MATQPDKEYPQDVVRGTFFEHDVPIKDMFVHFRTEPDGYARPLRQWRVNYLTSNFDRQSLGVILLSMRPDGTFAILDGQHRVRTAQFKGLLTMDAMVYIDLTLEDEARLYRKFGDYLRQTPLDRYHAGVAESLPEYLAIQRILGKLGLHVPNALGSSNNAVDAVEALIKVSTIYTLQGLQDTLQLIHDAWQGEHQAYRSVIIQGTAAFLARFKDNPKYHRKRLVSRMTRDGINPILRRAYGIRDANLAPNPNAGWGQALLVLHDQRISPGSELGDWPKRHYTEQAAATAAANIRRINAGMTPEQLRDRAIKAQASLTQEQKTNRALKAAKTRRGFTVRTVTCSYCHAGPGAPCVSKNDVDMPNYHEARRKAAKAWAESKLKP